MFRALCLFVLSLAIVAGSARDVSQAHDRNSGSGDQSEATALCFLKIEQERAPGCGTHQYLVKAKARTLKQKAARPR